jgi:polysaccharide biosynthesis transport protein
MELAQLIKPLLKWWWLLIASMVIAAVSSYLVVSRQPNTFQSHTTLMIGNFIQDPNPNSSEYYLAQELASTYADIANRELIQSETQKVLGLPFLPSNYTRAIPQTSLLEITVNDADPKRAQIVANELANQLIKNSPSSIGPEEEERQKFIHDQLISLQSQIKDTQASLDKLQQQYGDLTSARQIADAQTQISALQQKIISLQSTYSSLLSNTQKGATNTLTVIESAGISTTPVAPNRMLVVLISSLIGLCLASLAAYVIEWLDNTIKTVEEVNNLTKAPILGYIEDIAEAKSAFVLNEPRSPVSDSFRILRTNLDYLGIKNSPQVILISSAEVSDGKSTIALNLAASIAQANNKKVYLIDGDLRKPSLHKALSIKNENGLSDICLGSLSLQSAIISLFGGTLNFIPAGTPPPNPVELLDSPRMTQSIESLRALADVIIIDCPPVFLADTMILSGKADGLIFVISLGRTHKKSVMEFMKQAQESHINLIGVVVNRVPVSESHYPYYHYYRNEPEEASPSDFSSFIRKINKKSSHSSNNGKASRIGVNHVK